MDNRCVDAVERPGCAILTFAQEWGFGLRVVCGESGRLLDRRGDFMEDAYDPLGVGPRVPIRNRQAEFARNHRDLDTRRIIVELAAGRHRELAGVGQDWSHSSLDSIPGRDCFIVQGHVFRVVALKLRHDVFPGLPRLTREEVQVVAHTWRLVDPRTHLPRFVPPLSQISWRTSVAHQSTEDTRVWPWPTDEALLGECHLVQTRARAFG